MDLNTKLIIADLFLAAIALAVCSIVFDDVWGEYFDK